VSGAIQPPVLPDGTPRAAGDLRRAPDLREMALIAGLAFFLNIFPGSVLQIAHLRWGLLVTQTVFIAGPVLLALRWFYLDPETTLALRRPPRPAWAAAGLGILGLNHLLTVAGAWQEGFFPMPEEWKVFYEAMLTYRGPLDFAWLLVAFAAVPAVCEEILFRGFLQSGLVRLLGSAPRGIAVTALVFAVFHLDPWRFFGILVLGLFLGLLVHRSGSLLPAIGGHCLNNVLSIAGTALAAGPATEPGHPAAAAAVAMTAAALWILLRRPRRAPGKPPDRVL
jgi:membrane protease YdiL (CAAX protease family)